MKNLVKKIENTYEEEVFNFFLDQGYTRDEASQLFALEITEDEDAQTMYPEQWYDEYHNDFDVDDYMFSTQRQM